MLPMNQRPRAVIRDGTGTIVPPERWSDEQRRQARASIADQFRHGIQRETLEEFRDELAARWSYVESWEEEQAVREWILRQLDGLIQLNQTPHPSHSGQTSDNPIGPGTPQFLDSAAARKRPDGTR